MENVNFILILLLFTSCVSPLKKHENTQAITTVSFNYFDNRIMVPIMINDQGPFHMVFDTGGVNTLMPETAKKLKLKTTNAGFGGGAGDKEIPIKQVKIKNYKVGHILMEDQDFYVMDLSQIKKAFNFKDFDGIIGYELLKKYIVTINYDDKKLIFNTFKDFKPKGSKINFRLYGDKPVISATVQGKDTEFLVDTGDRSSFTLFKKFSDQHKLSKYFKKQEVISGYGVGGPIPARLGSIPSLKLNNKINLSKTPARLPLTKTGFFAQSDLGGSIGNGILQDFEVSFNYKDNEMYLSPGKKLNSPYKFIPPRKLIK